MLVDLKSKSLNKLEIVNAIQTNFEENINFNLMYKIDYVELSIIK